MTQVAPAPLALPLPSSAKQSPATSPRAAAPRRTAAARGSLELSRGASHSPRLLPQLSASPYAVKTQAAPCTSRPHTPRSPRSPRSPRTRAVVQREAEEDRAEHIEREEEQVAHGSDAAAPGTQEAEGKRKKSKGEQLKESARRKRRGDNKVHPTAEPLNDLLSSTSVQPPTEPRLALLNQSPFSSSTQTSSTLSSSSSSSRNQLSPAVPPLLPSVPVPALAGCSSPLPTSASSPHSNFPALPLSLALSGPQSLPADFVSSPTNASATGGLDPSRQRPQLSIAIPPTPAHHHTATSLALTGGYSPMQLPTSTNTPQGSPLPLHDRALLSNAGLSGPASSRQPHTSSSPRPVAALPVHSLHNTSTAAALRTARAQPLITAVMSPYTLQFQSIDQRTGRPFLFTPASRSQSSTPGAAPLYRTTTGMLRESLEVLFLSHYFHKYNTSNRVSIVISTIIWALFVINDTLKEFAAQRQDFDATVALRAVDCAIGVGIAVALGSKWLHSQPVVRCALYEQLLMYFGMITFGLSQVMFGVWQRNTLDPSYSIFIILIPSMAPTFFHQRFLFTCAFSCLLVPLFIILTLATSSYGSASNSSVASTFVGIVLANAFFCVFAYRREKSLREDFLSARQLEAEERKSQALLNNMMPVSAVAKLRAGAEYIYNKHEDVTILFSHIADFDDYTARLPPHRLVAFLNDLFYKFDQLTDELHVYKVETIGDVFLVCSNCPVEYERDDHAAILCVMALAMMEVVRELKAGQGDADEQPVRLKLGIHTGEVIAGVVGAKYPRFRLMGDTVNTASRMSTTTPANSIQLSPATHILISEKKASDGTPAFTCKERGPVAIKGKGMINTHFLLAHAYEHSRQHHAINTRHGQLLSGRRGNGAASNALTPREDSEQNSLNATQAEGAELAGVIRTRAQRIKGLGTMTSHSPETHAEWAEEDADGMLASHTPSYRQSVTASMVGSPGHFRMDSTGRPHSREVAAFNVPEGATEEAGVEDSLRRTADLAVLTAPPPAAANAQSTDMEVIGRRPSLVGLSSRAQPGADSSAAQAPVAVFHLNSADAAASLLPSVASAAQASPRVALIQREEASRLPISNGSQSPARRRLQLRSTSNLPSPAQPAARTISADSTAFVLPSAEPPSAKLNSRGSNASDSLGDESDAEHDSGVDSSTAAQHRGHNRMLTSDSSAPVDFARGASGVDTNSVAGAIKAASHHAAASFAQPQVGETPLAAKKQTRWDSSIAPDKHDSRAGSQLSSTTDRFTLTASSSMSTIAISPIATTLRHPANAHSAARQSGMPSGAQSGGSKRDSGDQQKLLITATNDTVKMDRLFKLGPTQSIMRPKGRRPWDFLTQRFITEPELELQFQKHWAVRCTPTTRFWVLFCVLAFIPLSVYETVINLNLLDGDMRLMIESWLVRLVGILFGGAYWWSTYRPFYQRYMQSITSAMLTIEGCLFIYMAIEYHDYDTSFGIGVTLILLCIVQMFVGLRFLYALLCSAAILLFYVAASRIMNYVPAVIVMVLAGNLMYAESNYWGEFLARQDYIRGLKRENEKVRTQQFLDNMLPPLVLDMIKQGNIVAQFHQHADVLFCDIVSFTSIASAIPAEDVVAVLNVMFSTYDALSTQYSVYKVETIGDCWMGCCGVVSHEQNHTQNMVDLALAMIKSTRGFRVQTDQAKITAAAIENVDKLQSPQRADMNGRQTLTERKSSDGSEERAVQERARQLSKASSADPLSVVSRGGPTGRLTRSSLSFMMGLSSPTATAAVTALNSASAHSDPLATTHERPPLTRLGSATSSVHNSQSERESVKGHPLVVRIGIHSGPVIAGVVGRKCARYHLFGETVTVAEEMEQHGLAGKVVISECTRQSMLEGMSKEQLRNYDLEPIEPLVRAEPSPNTRTQRAATTAPGTTNAAGSVASPTTPVLPRVLHRYIIRRAARQQRSKGGGAVANPLHSQVRSSVTTNGLNTSSHASADKYPTANGQMRGSVAQRNRRIALDAVVT